MEHRSKNPNRKAGDSLSGDSAKNTTSGASDSSPVYPVAAGSKAIEGTSQEAAKAIQSRLAHLRCRATEALASLGYANVPELIAAPGVTREALHPRFSELRNLGLVEATGERRQSPSSRLTAVLRLTEEGSNMSQGGVK
ncbi:MAG: hypothetical protein RL764_842 [Pseudomonadota bacterium]